MFNDWYYCRRSGGLWQLVAQLLYSSTGNMSPLRSFATSPPCKPKRICVNQYHIYLYLKKACNWGKKVNDHFSCFFLYAITQRTSINKSKTRNNASTAHNQVRVCGDICWKAGVFMLRIRYTIKSNADTLMIEKKQPNADFPETCITWKLVFTQNLKLPQSCVCNFSPPGYTTIWF